MKNATVRDLRYHFKRVEHLLREGEEIQICKRKRVIAHLVPVKQKSNLRHRPDFMKRLKKIYGDRVMKKSGAELLAEERERF